MSRAALPSTGLACLDVAHRSPKLPGMWSLVATVVGSASRHVPIAVASVEAIQPVNVFLALDPITQRPLGYAHVDFATMQEAKATWAEDA